MEQKISRQTSGGIFFCIFTLIIFLKNCQNFTKVNANLYSQLQNQRSPISEYIPLSSYAFNEPVAGSKKRKPGTSETVLIINNWHFNRDVLEMTHPPACLPENCSVQIKISSSAFMVKDGASERHNFDKNGAIIPYPAFVWMCDDGKTEVESMIEEILHLHKKDLKGETEEPTNKKNKKPKK